jgi:poly-beta-1,6-N-acetyl-D-glucosamine N-deacetylase
MTLNPKNHIMDYKILAFRFLSKCQGILTILLLVFVNWYSLSQNTALAEDKAVDGCSNDIGLQQVSNLASTTVEVSTWVNNPQIGVKTLVQVFGSHFLTYLNVGGFSQSGLDSLVAPIWQRVILPLWSPSFDFTNQVRLTKTTINQIPLILISGGKPITIHADSRYQLKEVVSKSGTNAIAAVDGTFFSLKYLTSNVIIGPVFSQVNNKFIPGNNSENKKLAGRPLVLISSNAVRYIPFDPDKHNTLAGIQAEMSEVSDAFVAGAWLVKNNQPLAAITFKSLYGADVPRHRAFWGINQSGVPTIGVSTESVDSANLAIMLTKAGMRDAVMLDSGQSTSLVYKGESLVNYEPRPVPHAIALLETQSKVNTACLLVVNKTKNQG